MVDLPKAVRQRSRANTNQPLLLELEESRIGPLHEMVCVLHDNLLRLLNSGQQVMYTPF